MIPETTEDELARATAFIKAFFGPGNDAASFSGVLQSYEPVVIRGESPVVLPRFSTRTQDATMYVIANDPVLAPHIPELINAFAGPTYCKTADIVPSVMSPDDAVEAAVIARYGPDTPVYVLSAGKNPLHRRRLRNALERMQRAVSRRPRRELRLVKPIGRLLGEFEAALSTGGEATSAEVLNQIVRRGGLTASNLIHLRIKRLDRLGLGGELLRMRELPGVLAQSPPIRVRESVLKAVFQTVLAPHLESNDVETACERLRDLDPALTLPWHDAVDLYGTQAAGVLLVAAIGREDPEPLRRALALRGTPWADELPAVLWKVISAAVGGAAPAATTPASGENLPAEIALPGDWIGFFQAAANQDRAISVVIRDEIWRSWPSLGSQDSRIRELLTTLSDQEWMEVWQVVGVLIEALEDHGEAPQTTEELLAAALSVDRLSRGDLLSLYALTEIFLRSSPSRTKYIELLDIVSSSARQWAGALTSDIALDFADRLVVAACPDDTARTAAAIALLEPLHRNHRRLESEDAALAQRLCGELGVPLEWPELNSEEHGFTLAEAPALSVLLYSLDEAVLARVSDELTRQAKDLKVFLSHDKVGTDSLKQKSRNADVVVLATRCAKHAATGFIIENKRRSTRVEYADGSGSASLLRAAVRGVREATR
ncbi:DUF2325 domain-containing protein [Actinokineospora sp. PR83]|uniref:DUF2325 domain-containing protein n=1 Tax=Actinokineospora sp. PR83 TaxID=2884908 RepID=UPI001F1B383A|nr:DUF2325 domain-containing protein [Actinokineospora sp. PR83]MCG8917390.1 DUF2325 domain-containing protein [Actinokineospora sp. PR83]